jgi:hypothetical protein
MVKGSRRGVHTDALRVSRGSRPPAPLGSAEPYDHEIEHSMHLDEVARRESAAWSDEGIDALEPDVLGRREGAAFLERQAQLAGPRKRQRLRRQAVRLRFTGSTQKPLGSWRSLPACVRSPRRAIVARPREHRTRRVARTCGSRGDPHPPGDDDDEHVVLRRRLHEGVAA